MRVIAPSGPFDRESFDRGLARLASRYQPVFDEGLFSQERYLAGPDARRAQELSSALAEEHALGVFAARGGYGAVRLLPKLTLSDVAPKLVVGFSDITALHAALGCAGWVSIHGPVLTQLGRQQEHFVERLFHLLEKDTPAPPLEGSEAYAPGVAEGPLLGGNLSVFTRLLGTPYLPPLDGAVLLLEDVGERPYRLDRMWTHLKLAGVFERVAGIALGSFTGCEEKDAGYTGADVLRSLADETGLPCLAGLPIGHGDDNAPVPLGCRVRLDTSARTLEFLEPATVPR